MSADPRLSLNQMTIDQSGMEESIRLCHEAGIAHIGLWRHKFEDVGVEQTAVLLKRAGISASSLCRGGFFPVDDRGDQQRRRADNRLAVDEAEAVGTDTLILVVGACRTEPRSRSGTGDSGRGSRRPDSLRVGTWRAPSDRAPASDVQRRSFRDRHPRPGSRRGRKLPLGPGRRRC